MQPDNWSLVLHEHSFVKTQRSLSRDVALEDDNHPAVSRLTITTMPVVGGITKYENQKLQVMLVAILIQSDNKPQARSKPARTNFQTLMFFFKKKSNPHVFFHNCYPHVKLLQIGPIDSPNLHLSLKV